MPPARLAAGAGLDPDAHVVIIGTGQAGTQAAISLRAGGFTGRIDLVGDDAHAPYQRPPLSKTFISGAKGHESVALRPLNYYAEKSISLRMGVRAVSVHRMERRVEFDDGTDIGYDHLIIATGVRARALPPSLSGSTSVTSLRDLDDAVRLRSALAGSPPTDVVIIGGGFIGLELAATAVQLAHRVTVLEAQERTMSRVVSRELSEYVEKEHRDRGVQLILGAIVAGVEPAPVGQVGSVLLSDGTRLPASLVMAGVGVIVNCEWLDGSGLALSDGVVVDKYLSTADPDISAIGDCARFPSLSGHGYARLESVQNAVDQAKYVARRLLGDTTDRYCSPPWFWTHQYDMRIQMAGLPDAASSRRVVGHVEDGRFSVLHYAEGRLVCVESVNSAADHMAARKAFAEDLEVLASALEPFDGSLPLYMKSRRSDAALH